VSLRFWQLRDEAGDVRIRRSTSEEDECGGVVAFVLDGDFRSRPSSPRRLPEHPVDALAQFLGQSECSTCTGEQREARSRPGRQNVVGRDAGDQRSRRTDSEGVGRVLHLNRATLPVVAVQEGVCKCLTDRDNGI
jgi:hypothetical protein